VIENHTILCFASGYDAPPTSKHHVMHVLAERNTVLWVNYHASRAPSATGSDIKHIARKLGQVAAGLKNPRPNLYVLTPLVVPLPGSAWAKSLNRALLIRQIRTALRKLSKSPQRTTDNGQRTTDHQQRTTDHGPPTTNPQSPTPNPQPPSPRPLHLWSFTPDISYLLGRFGEEKTVYYCVDDHAAFTGYNRDQVLRDEEELCRRADLVVTTSTALQEAKSPLNPNTILVPHGVDYEHFARALGDDLTEPADVAKIPHPRLGFFGLLRDWVDLDLLAKVARRRPEWHFVLIGDATFDVGPYRRLANMHFLGRRPYADLPAYCKSFDVGLIPFKLNELTRAVNPIKLREYLAAGLPVVSTPLPEVLACNGYAHTAQGPDNFLTAIDSALSTNHYQLTTSSSAMSRETWPAKVEAICTALEQCDTTLAEVVA
jgi:glycosyltransferase involved in cell wall biosynthesis